MRQDLKLKLAAAVCAGACLLMFAGLLRAGPVPCDQQAARFAWASPNAAAFAWASQPTADCHCKPSCNCSPCACAELTANSRIVIWKHVGGDEYHLIIPPHCNGQRCLPEQLIGGWNGQFRYWDGKAWGPVVQPPIAPPATPVLKQTNRWTLQDAATLITAGLLGIVDDCPGGVCPPQKSAAGKPPTTFSGVSMRGNDAARHAVAEGPRRKAKRALAAPFRMVKHTRHAFHARMHVRRGR